MPPLDWDSPQTFSPLDRDAWKLVQEEADQGETLAFDVLLGADVYIETGRRLFRRLAAHYHPLAANPLDDVPLVELLTALELAAEDLSGLCRQIPGGDLISLSHWRKAVQVAGYINRANDLYAYLMPFLNPVSGLARLGTREWIVKPAWKSMQQNVLRWFYQAYVNRLGMHLIELLSGRLAIGAHQYRRLTRRPAAALPGGPAGEIKPLTIAVAGAGGAGKSRLIAMIGQACSGDPSLLKAPRRTAGSRARTCSNGLCRRGGSRPPITRRRRPPSRGTNATCTRPLLLRRSSATCSFSSSTAAGKTTPPTSPLPRTGNTGFGNIRIAKSRRRSS